MLKAFKSTTKNYNNNKDDEYKLKQDYHEEATKQHWMPFYGYKEADDDKEEEEVENEEAAATASKVKQKRRRRRRRRSSHMQE